MSTILVDVDDTRPATHVTRAPARAVRPKTRCQPEMRVRLTRLGRLVLLIVVFGLAFGALSLLSGPAASTSQAHHEATHTVVVEPGQTLWDIAASAAPGEDPRDVVAEIVELNALADAGAIRVGQPLDIPTR